MYSDHTRQLMVRTRRELEAEVGGLRRLIAATDPAEEDTQAIRSVLAARERDLARARELQAAERPSGGDRSSADS